jgi:hypothetical protein
MAALVFMGFSSAGKNGILPHLQLPIDWSAHGRCLQKLSELRNADEEERKWRRHEKRKIMHSLF